MDEEYTQLQADIENVVYDYCNSHHAEGWDQRSLAKHVAEFVQERLSIAKSQPAAAEVVECTGVKMACASGDAILGDFNSALKMYSEIGTASQQPTHGVEGLDEGMRTLDYQRDMALIFLVAKGSKDYDETVGDRIERVQELILKLKSRNEYLERSKEPPLPADKQTALDALINETCQEDTKFLRTKIIDYSDYPAEGCKHLENMCVLLNKQRSALKEFRAALTAPVCAKAQEQPVADLDKEVVGLLDLDGLKRECVVGTADEGHIRIIFNLIDHLHATGRLNTAQQAEEIKALKDAVRDLDEAATKVCFLGRTASGTAGPDGPLCDGLGSLESCIEKHAATIEAAKEE